MSSTSLPIIIKSVKFEYDRYNLNQVFDAIRTLYPNLVAKDFTAELIETFIPEDACSITWHKTLCNVEYNRSQPKKAKRNRYVSKGNRKYNPAEAITKATTFSTLMEVA